MKGLWSFFFYGTNQEANKADFFHLLLNPEG